MYRSAYDWSEEDEARWAKHRFQQREKYKIANQRRRKCMYGNKTNRENLKKALLDSAFHAKMIINRSIVSESNMRIGEFVTSLRRDIKDIGIKGSYSPLTDKDNWEGILIPRTKAFDEDTMRVIAEVRREVNDTSSSVYIEQGLSAVNKQVSDAMRLLKEIEVINDEANVILDDFKVLAKNIQD